MHDDAKKRHSSPLNGSLSVQDPAAPARAAQVAVALHAIPRSHVPSDSELVRRWPAVALDTRNQAQRLIRTPKVFKKRTASASQRRLAYKYVVSCNLLPITKFWIPAAAPPGQAPPAQPPQLPNLLPICSASAVIPAKRRLPALSMDRVAALVVALLALFFAAGATAQAPASSPKRTPAPAPPRTAFLPPPPARAPMASPPSPPAMAPVPAPSAGVPATSPVGAGAGDDAMAPAGAAAALTPAAAPVTEKSAAVSASAAAASLVAIVAAVAAAVAF